ncbi:MULTISPECIES: NAD(P)-dependent oxidoreductase [unclassified Fibrobacter]|uniref:NAD-dependent epimerase/dehydratase family protein n=1 Tax=unclassified Fibrobacter TaxID=2634177 RepID=UPI0009228876|nr:MULTISPECIES: NAD(P)-dependent oxidoreductase [unclassified Fibrobacter]SHK59754.1 UDP-glucose 4-epimerase [Fibrobacter sp. UWB12]SIN97459.1 UDP-glucose 4-epimerase [Fibrobacter sp. UWB11]
MRVFVTGGTGFIGHYVVKALLEKGHEVVVATRHPNKVPTLRSNPNVSFVEAALTDFEKMGEGLIGCDACIHVALGWGDTPSAMLMNDTRATVALLEMSARAGCEKFIMTSSTSAMGRVRSEMRETTSSMPIDLYGATKAAGEAYVLGFSHGYGSQFPEVKMKRNIIRPGYTFGNPAFPDGCSQPDRRFFEMAYAVKENRDIHIIKNDGTQFIHASQQAQIYMKLLESDLNEEIFLGLGSEWISWKEIAEKMIALKPDCTSKIVETDMGWGDEPMLYDVQKIKDTFGLVFDAHDFLDEHIRWTFENA